MLVALPLLVAGGEPAFAQARPAPLEFLKEQERRHKDERGQLYLGKVMDVELRGAPDALGEEDQGLLLELTDVLKSPLRDSYRLALRGCSPVPAGSPGQLTEELKRILARKYGLGESRISLEAGCKGPVGRVELHVYGDVSQAVRFLGMEEKQR
jgi:hypothetical protein